LAVEVRAQGCCEPQVVQLQRTQAERELAHALQGVLRRLKRFAHAFTGEWILLGGNLPQSFALVPTQDGLRALRRDLTKLNVDAILIAVDGADAPLVRTFAPRVTAWASGQVNQRQGPSAARDLETGVRHVESELNAATPESGAAPEATLPPAPPEPPAASAAEAAPPRQASLPGFDRG